MRRSVEWTLTGTEAPSAVISVERPLRASQVHPHVEAGGLSRRPEHRSSPPARRRYLVYSTTRSDLSRCHDSKFLRCAVVSEDVKRRRLCNRCEESRGHSVREHTLYC